LRRRSVAKAQLDKSSAKVARAEIDEIDAGLEPGHPDHPVSLERSRG
jgi:hypothetical protein